MYLPTHFEESRPAVLHALMEAHPLATLVHNVRGVLDADHIPLRLHTDGTGPALLVGHVARANPLWHDSQAGKPVLAIFQGSQAYISPSWYPTKGEHGKVVPTWNYCVVHVHGILRAQPDAAWLRALVGELTATHEASMPAPWAVGDAPTDYIDQLLGQIMGIEITVEHTVGKWKASQNQPERNRAGARAGLNQAGGERQRAMADLIGLAAPRAPTEDPQ